MLNKQTKTLHKDFSVIDLFCGIGGLTHGFILEDFFVDLGIDFDESCKFAFEENNKAKFLHKDITTLTPTELSSYFTKKNKILIGCAPCQPFSLYRQSLSKDKNIFKSDEKWALLYSFANLIKEVQPDIISMENVPQVISFDNGKIFSDFVESLKEADYQVSYFIVNAQDYGVPQRRKRLVLFGSKYGLISLIDKTVKNRDYVTVRKSIGHLPFVEDGIAFFNDPLHKSRKLTEINKKRIQASKPGGTWRDWDEELIPNCRKTENGRLFSSVYGRMKWDDVAPTITTYCTGINNGRFGHPEQDRPITLREAALLQSFPETYKFIPSNMNFSFRTIAKHIGNAVPVGLSLAIARSIKGHIENIGR